MEELKFFFLVRLGLRLYQLVTPTITAIQAKGLSIGEVLRKVELLETAVLAESQNAPFQHLWLDCVAEAEELCLEEPRLRRAISKPAKLREAGEDASQPKTPEDAHRSEYIAAMDGLPASLHHRFSGGDDTALRGVEAALAGDEAEGRRVATFYGLDADRLDLHFRFMHDMGRTPATLQEAAKMPPELEDMVPEAAPLM